MYEYSTEEKNAVDALLRVYFPGVAEAETFSDDEKAMCETAVASVQQHFDEGKKYVLGLLIDFCLLAQRLAAVDESLRKFNANTTFETIQNTYTIVDKRGDKEANSLTIKLNNKQYGIRKTQEVMTAFFHKLGRTKYPSAYVYNTGQWKKFTDLLAAAFQLSPVARMWVVRQLVELALSKYEKNVYFVKQQERIPLFYDIITEYPRAGKGENGGLTFQALSFAFISVDRPHLAAIADKVRTGSKRQQRFGDVDCYYGLSLEVISEVKDIHITLENVDAQLGQFMKTAENTGVMAIAFVASIEDDAKAMLIESGVIPVTHQQMADATATWDFPK